jgi:hypothetical protein
LLPRQIEALESSWVIVINQVIESIIAGCAVSCGAVLVVAGAGKLYRGIRGLEDMTAIRRALRMPRRQWRLFGLAAGGAESVMGVVVCSGAYPVFGGASLAALGAVFCALLAYLMVKRVPGDCGCIRWRAATATSAESLTWRPIARGGMLLGVGLAYLVISTDTANVPRQYWFGGGIVAGAAVLALLSMPRPVRFPACRGPLRRRTRTTLRALAGHETFAVMASSAGPFGPTAWHRRSGCTHEFWFTAPTGRSGQAVIFRVYRAAPGARLAVHASLRNPRTPGASWPTRTVTVADVLAEMQCGAEDSNDPRSRKHPALRPQDEPRPRQHRAPVPMLIAARAPVQAGNPSGKRRETL